VGGVRTPRLVVDLAANLAWPFAILTWASGADALGPRWAPLVAMLAPLAHAGYRRVVEGRTGALPVLVVLSIGLNAAAGFLPMDARWFALKEALLPVAFGALFAGSAFRGPGLLAELVHELVDADKLAAALAAKGTGDVYRARLRAGALRFGGVTATSGLLGGAVALALVRAPTGTEAFAQELGRYTAWSWPLVNLPVLIATAWVLRGVLDAVEQCAGQRLEDLAKG
jgi:hypothetical protein